MDTVFWQFVERFGIGIAMFVVFVYGLHMEWWEMGKPLKREREGHARELEDARRRHQADVDACSIREREWREIAMRTTGLSERAVEKVAQVVQEQKRP